MPFVTDFVTRKGGRELNEDYCGFVETGGSGCWVVADGLGGHQGGEVAGRLAVEAVLNSFRSNPAVTEAALRNHLQSAQQAILQAQKSQPALSTMRTTIVVLVTNSKRALWAHVGDSRLYCFENGRIAFFTRDHSVVQAMVNAGELSADEIRHNEDRNRLLRCLGNTDGELRPTILAEPHTLFRGTSFVLCTDGFWENIRESEMEVDFVKAATPKEWLAFMTDRVMQQITESSDNYTAMAVTFDSVNAPAPPKHFKPAAVSHSRTGMSRKSRLARMSLSAVPPAKKSMTGQQSGEGYSGAIEGHK